MTKKDTKAVVTGAAIGLSGFLLLWFFGRKLISIPEIHPSLVKWEGQ